MTLYATMAEIGLAASVIQVVSTGVQVSKTLYEYVDSVKSADGQIITIAQQIRFTTTIVTELERVFKDPSTAKLMSKDATTTAEEALAQCLALFKDIDGAIDKSRKPFGKLVLPLRETRLTLYGADLERLKSSMQLLM